jgi:serine/threonine-protein kinase
VEPASDVYSIATMLFQCLSGQTPFDAESPVAILVKHTSEPAPDVRSHPRSSYVPEPIARVIAENLAKDPKSRCPDARQFGRALARAARDAGLSPDELTLRSTLLGDPSAALQLASMERTRAMTYPSTDAGSPTMIDEGPPEFDAAPGELDAAAAPSGVPTSRVEPTLSDEPHERLSAPTASQGPRTSQSESASIPPFHADSGPGPEARSQRTRGHLRRDAVIVGCFLLGGGLAVLSARLLGAFDPPPPTAQQYVDRANAAVAVSAWDAPAGENVRDITDAALQRFPGSKPVLDVRRHAVRILVRRAKAARDVDATQALRLARIARDLDPHDADTAELLAELTGQSGDRSGTGAPAVEQPELEPSTTRPSTAAAAPRSRREPDPRGAPVAPPAPTAPAPTTSAPATPPQPGKESGRWL